MENIIKKNRAIVLLAAYDSQALYLTLQSLNHTLSENEIVVIILNGKRGIRAGLVEEVARDWIKGKINKYVVRPLNYGNDPYNSIKEVLNNFEPLKNAEYICKIDDDLIPLKDGWLDSLQDTYINSEKSGKMGFVTSLINNNTWGFAELLKIFNKQKEYEEIMNYPSESGEGIVKAKQIANGVNGTIWQYPYLAKWCHEWTTLNLNNYLEKTENLSNKEISPDTHYSIGCILFRKEFWNQIEEMNKTTNFDELSIQLFCKANSLSKVAVMNQPMAHLYYFVQRKANAQLLPLFAQSFGEFWQDKKFLDYPKFDNETQLMVHLEELSNSGVLQNFSGGKPLPIRAINYIKKKFIINKLK